VFGAASAVTPVLLGMSLGLLSNGAIRSIDGRSSFDLTAWFGPSPLLIGALAMAVCSYLAAVYLAVETRGELREDFRRRGLWTLVALVALSLGGLPILRSYDPHLWEGLTGRSSWVIVLGLAAAALSGSSLARRRFILARVAAVAYAASLLIGWGIAQYPYLIYPDFPIAGSAAREPALVFILWAVPLGMLVLVPSLVLLFRVFKRDVE
jgi:cytochrome d ubiquinol oxidase subunit II